MSANFTLNNLPFGDVFERKGANGAAGNGIVWRCKNTIDQVTIQELSGGLNFVKVERMFPWYRTIESSLEKCRPIVPEFVRTTLVRFADAGHA